MALRFALSFDHLPSLHDSNANWAKVIGNLPLLFQKGSGSTKAHVISSDGWMTGAYANQAGWSTMVIRTSEMVKGTPKKSWFGIRLKCINLGSIASNFSLTWVADNTYPVNNTFLQGMDYGMLGGSLASNLNKEHYLELGFNWATGTIERYLNGVYHSTLTVTGITSQFAARNVAIFIPGTSINNHQLMSRDIYWIDDTEDGTLCDRLGPQRMVLLNHTADATDWAPSAGTATDILNTKIGLTAETLDLPTLTSPATPTLLKSQLALPEGQVIQKVNAVTVLTSVRSQTGSDGNFKIALEDGSDMTPPVIVPITGTMTHNRSSRLGLFERAPDGQGWNMTKLANTKLVIDPS